MRKVSAIRSLTTEFLRAGGFPWACYLSPAASSWIGSATSFCHLLAAQGRPRCFSLPPCCFYLGPSKRRATGPLLDPGGDYPRFTQFLLLSSLFYRPPSLPRLPD